MKTLTMQFITKTGSKVSMNVTKVKDDINTLKIKTLMDFIKSKGIFTFNGGTIIALDDAEITESNTNKVQF